MSNQTYVPRRSPLLTHFLERLGPLPSATRKKYDND
ncbi:hypothetical protein P3T16_001392 [Paraburkholderia sp. GAS42]